MNREMNGLDTTLSVVVLHCIPVDTTMLNVNICLNIEDTCYASLTHCFCIFLELWVWANENSSLAYLVKSQTSHKICIGFFNMTINHKTFLDISPDIASLNTKLTVVIFWVLNVEASAWFSLPNRRVLLIISDKILIDNSLWAYAILESHRHVIWLDLLSSEPNNIFTGQLHVDRPVTLLPKAELWWIAIYLHIFSLLEWIIH